MNFKIGRLKINLGIELLGQKATLPENPAPVPGESDWKLHRCADGQQCRDDIPGGCAGGWCSHFKVKPDEEGVSRFPSKVC